MPHEILSDRYATPAGMGAGLVEFADGMGIDIRPECEALSLDPDIFDSMTEHVSLGRFCALLERCAILSGDEAFGLKFAAKYKPGSTGAYGYGLMCTPTLEAFLRFQQEHLQYVSHTCYTRLEFGPETAVYSWTYSPAIMQRDQYVDFGTALTIRHMKRLFGPATSRFEITLERAPPLNEKAFREALGNHVRFRAEMNTLTVPADLLSLANPQADERLFKLMDIQCRALRPTLKENDDLQAELEDFILSRLSEDDISLSSASHYFGVSERTLQRRLAELDTTLNDLRDSLRRKLARQMVAETLLSATEISYRLGYSAPSAFTRSFQRWFGQSPRDYRYESQVLHPSKEEKIVSV